MKMPTQKQIRKEINKRGLLADEKGQANAIIGVVLTVAIVGLILMFTSAINVKTFGSVQSIVANPGNANISADVNGAIENSFDAINTVSGFMGVLFLAILAAVAIGIFLRLGSVSGGSTF